MKVIAFFIIKETNTKKDILTNIKEKKFAPTNNEIELYYRASFFGAGIKEMCRLWLERDCKETPEEMAKLLLDEYKNRDR